MGELIVSWARPVKMMPRHLGAMVALISLLTFVACNSSPANGSPALGPGCLGSAGEPCASAPDEVTRCPGGPTVCVQCGAGVYTPSQSFCTCTSGKWDCAPPAAGQVQCPNPVANSDFYVDPACSLPFGGDAGIGAVPEGGSAEAGAVAADAGAGNAEGGVLDCAWASGNNCWKTAIETAASCLPPTAQQGTFGANVETCTYASGTIVTFASPYGLGSIPNFTVISGGKMCLGFRLEGTDVTLTTPGGALTYAVEKASDTLTLTCPNGATYSGSGANLSSCPGFPGFETASGSGPNDARPAQSMSLAGTDGPNGMTTVFDCTGP